MNWQEHRRQIRIKESNSSSSRLRSRFFPFFRSWSVVYYEDGAFANETDEKSQYGTVFSLSHHPDSVALGKFNHAMPIGWQSSTIKRVVRSTLGAEAYAVSEATESAIWIAQLLTEFSLKKTDSRRCRDIENAAEKRS